MLGRGLVGQAPTQNGNLSGSSRPAPPMPDRALDFLILGVDGRDDGNGYRADTVLIAHIPRDRSRIYLISLPRDLQAKPGPEEYKLNRTFQEGVTGSGAEALSGGLKSTTRAVARLTGVSFDGSAVLTYTGLRRLTDAVGGVRVCLPQPVRSMHTERRFPARCQQLDGRASIDLLRQRYGLRDGAQDRDRNGQRFTHALMDRVFDGDDPMSIMKMIAAAGDGLAFDTGATSPVDLFNGLRDVAGAEPLGISLRLDYRGDQEPRPGFSWADPAVADALFTAVRQDDLAAWVSAHPEQLTTWSAQR
jgi:LCP family protein required for cell wall assembly